MHRTKFNSAIAKKDNGFPQAGTYLDFIQRQRGAKKSEVERVQLFETNDEKMMRIHDIIWQIADSEVPVLISGETGSGKEYIADCIRKANPNEELIYEVFDCKKVADSQLEAALFGVEAEAFPGAAEGTKGAIENANGGMLVIKNITELSLNAQANLLNTIQNKKLHKVGARDEIDANVRIIACTSENLAGLVAKGEFKQELYYRLYVIHLEVPPLRERQKDIASMANSFLSAYKSQFDKSGAEFSEKAMDKIVAHSWAGNIAELKSVVQKATILAENDLISPDDIPIKSVRTGNDMDWVASLPVGQSLRTVETQFILRTLKEHQGNRTHAARTLGISLRTLRNKINEFSSEGFDVTAPQNGRSAS